MRNRMPAIAPSRAEMDRRNAPLYAARAQAVAVVDAMLREPGADLRSLYTDARAKRDESPLAAAISAELMGRLRRA